VGTPVVRREPIEVGGGRRLSTLVWGDGDPELVLLHGSGQNAHTWDTVALALGRPLVAVDLPGHGHSDGGSGSLDGDAEDLATVIAELAPDARAVVGMSAGGLLALTLTTRAAHLVRRLVLVDILPSHDPAMAKRIHDFIDGPDTFDSFDDLLARTVAFNPTRSVSSLRRGILHNAVQLDDGSWQWRHRRHQRATGPEAVEAAARRTGALWDAIEALPVPLLLVRGMADGSVLDDAAEAELVRRAPGAAVARVAGAGHSVQGDRPVELAGLISDFVAERD
jgi:pimeloyl-ACP methyl ester carboxylesterase